MNEIHKLMQEVTAFSEERDWDQFHSPENLAKSIAIEAAELLECAGFTCLVHSLQTVSCL